MKIEEKYIKETPTIITVNINHPLHAINPGLLGVNHRYFLNGVGMWDPELRRVKPEFQEKFDTIGLTTIRYPGGTTANLFQWKRAIGAYNTRIPQVDPYLDMGPDDCSFGLDEALRFAESNHMETLYVYNFGNGNAQDAAELVEYLNAPNDGKHPMAALRAANGHPEPYNIRSFEIGNEIAFIPQLVDQEYWLRGAPESQWAELYVHGGTVNFTDQNTGLESDWRDSAAKSDGSSLQVKYIKYAPVNAAVMNPQIKVAGQSWNRIESLIYAGKEDVYVLDEQTGAIYFGDGTHGNIPPLDSIITASYSTTHDGFKDYVKSMKAVDPTINVYMAMNIVDVLVQAGKDIDYDGMVIHPYGSFEGPFDPDNIPQYYYSAMVDAERKVQVVKNLQISLQNYSGRDIKPVITEYALHDSEFKKIGTTNETALYYEGTLGAALYSAYQLIQFIKMDLDYALRHSLIDRMFEKLSATPMAFFDTYTFLKSAHAWMMEMFCQRTGEMEVQSYFENVPELTVTVSENGQPVQRTIPLLSGMASVEGNECYLMVLNSSADNPISASINLPVNGVVDAEVWSLTAENIDDYNTDEQPDKVIKQVSAVSVFDGVLNYSFPAHSLTAFKVIMNA
ncbi:alpha-L-arabinofuranosidase C-terminal domain-containing protein [Pantoea sp.]|uniref:alpha-L-arabinofuranosidase C-terminal domain-containing protein n=1 Tax=Pantoea sp. TaxID=69393 RepID=UPI00289FAB9E|nr:alpha-L-arabinofuranosidase C-terminal domain-containing protein [Pantoea sp.]